MTVRLPPFCWAHGAHEHALLSNGCTPIHETGYHESTPGVDENINDYVFFNYLYEFPISHEYM